MNFTIRFIYKGVIHVLKTDSEEASMVVANALQVALKIHVKVYRGMDTIYEYG